MHILPGFTTHYIFGLKAFFQLPDCVLKSIISNHKDLFRLGLQGPDIFFCHPKAAIGTNQRNVGSQMHELKVNEYFENCLDLIETLQDNQQEMAIAYVAGFFCHYVFDSVMHPYIYSRVGYVPNLKKGAGQISGAHAQLETMIDNWLLQYYKGDEAKKFRKIFTVMLPQKKIEFVAQFLSKTINETYYKDYQILQSVKREDGKLYQKRFFYKNGNPYRITEQFIINTLRFFRIETNALHDETGRKKKYIELIERHTIKYPLLSAMILSGEKPDKRHIFNLDHEVWENPWNPSIQSKESLVDLFEESKVRCESILHYFNSYLDALQSSKEYGALKMLLLISIGNNSYHSGLDCASHDNLKS